MKNSKNWDARSNCPKYEKLSFYHAGIHPEYVDGMANSVDPDQTALLRAV